MYALLSYPVGILSDKTGQKSILIIGLVIFAVVYGCYGFAAGTFVFVMLFALYALYAAATEGISKALISNMVSKSDTATAIGFYNSFASIFALAASSIGGFIWFAYSPKHMFVFSAIGTLLTVIYLIIRLSTTVKKHHIYGT
jgi:MFS family permease